MPASLNDTHPFNPYGSVIKQHNPLNPLVERQYPAHPENMRQLLTKTGGEGNRKAIGRFIEVRSLGFPSLI